MGSTVHPGLGLTCMCELPRVAVTNCHNVAQTTGICLPQSGGQKSNSRHCSLPPFQRLWEESPGLPAPGGCWHPLVCVCIPLISASIFLQPSLLCTSVSSSQLMVILSGDPSLVTSAKPLALNKSHSEVPDEHEVWRGH